MSRAATQPRSHESRGKSAAAPLLEAVGLCKTYQVGPKPLEVLKNCSLSVETGEFVAVTGKSGSGKSTLLHILGALDVPQSGQVHFRGGPVFAPSRTRRLRTNLTDVISASERRRNRLRREAFGFVFQFYHLLPELNVLENVLLPRMVACSIRRWWSDRRAARSEALAILERVGLRERLRHRPNELSGGERQRVAIARALVHRPDILFADEPTGNLDAEAGGRILALLKDIHRQGQTIVLVTHDSSIAQQADRVLRLEGGRLQPAS